MRSLVVAISLLMLNACQVKDMWLGGDDEELLPGHRLAVLADTMQKDLSSELEHTSIALPNPTSRVSWTQANGSHDNHVGMLKTPWPVERDNAERIGEGWDYPYAPAPVVAGGTIYVMDAEGDVSAYAMDQMDKPLWTYEENQDDRQFLGGGMALAGTSLVVVYPTGDVKALNSENGSILWSRRLSAPVRSAPKVARGIVLIQTVQSQLVAISLDDGAIKWTHRGIGGELRAMERVSPAVYVDSSVAVAIVAYGSGDVSAMTLEGGRELWQYAMSDAPSRANIGTRQAANAALVNAPAIYRNFAFLASRHGRVVALDIAKGISFWERELPPVQSSMLAETLWAIYLQDGRITMLHAADGRVLWTKDVGQDLLGPWLVNGELWMADQEGDLKRYDAAEGTVLETSAIPSDIASPPLMLDESIIWLTQDASLNLYRGE